MKINFKLLFLILLAINLNASEYVKPISEILRGRSATDAFKQEILDSKRPTIVKFFLKGCPPCIRMKSVFENLARELKNKVLCIEVEVSSFENIAHAFNIQSAPTFVGFIDGKEVNRVNGVVSISKLKNLISPYCNF